MVFESSRAPDARRASIALHTGHRDVDALDVLAWILSVLDYAGRDADGVAVFRLIGHPAAAPVTCTPRGTRTLLAGLGMTDVDDDTLDVLIGRLAALADAVDAAVLAARVETIVSYLERTEIERDDLARAVAA